MSAGADDSGLGAADSLLQSHAMAHPFDLDLTADESGHAEFDFFAVEGPLSGGTVPMAGLATDCGHTLSTVLCDCANTLSTLFCLSCEGCSG